MVHGAKKKLEACGTESFYLNESAGAMGMPGRTSFLHVDDYYYPKSTIKDDSSTSAAVNTADRTWGRNRIYLVAFMSSQGSMRQSHVYLSHHIVQPFQVQEGWKSAYLVLEVWV